MSYKKKLYSGIIICAVSLIAGFLWIFLGIHESFDALRSNDGAESISVVSKGIENALIANVIAIVGFLIGSILIVIGGIQAYRQSQSKNE